MKSVMFCWELGGGLGHIAKAAMFAERLMDHGVRVSFALRDLADAHALVPSIDYVLVQSPLWLRQAVGLGNPASYAEILLQVGFASPTGLIGLSRAWHGLFEAFSVDLIVADHAPNAILAARSANLPFALFGNGFFAPPAANPIPPFRSGKEITAQRLAGAETIALRGANACLEAFGAPPLGALHELLATPHNFLCTVAELDHYPSRPDAHYFGPVYLDDAGAEPEWPDTTKHEHRIFAYLKPQMPGLKNLLDALKSSSASVLVFCAGIDRNLRHSVESDSLRFLDGLVKLRSTIQEADLLVAGGTDTAYGALFNGVPVLGAPLTVEQLITAERIATLGAGLVGMPGESSESWASRIVCMLAEPSYRANARRFAARYRGYAPEESVDTIAQQCLALLS